MQPNPHLMVKLTLNLPRSLKERLEEHQVITGMPQSEAIRRALEAFLPKAESK